MRLPMLEGTFILVTDPLKHNFNNLLFPGSFVDSNWSETVAIT